MLDIVPTIERGIPDTVPPGQFFPWMDDAGRTAAPIVPPTRETHQT